MVEFSNFETLFQGWRLDILEKVSKKINRRKGQKSRQIYNAIQTNYIEWVKKKLDGPTKKRMQMGLTIVLMKILGWNQLDNERVGNKITMWRLILRHPPYRETTVAGRRADLAILRLNS
jgi:hypothetical protein